MYLNNLRTLRKKNNTKSSKKSSFTAEYIEPIKDVENLELIKVVNHLDPIKDAEIIKCKTQNPGDNYITRKDDIIGVGKYSRIYRTHSRINTRKAYAMKVVDLKNLTPREKELNLSETKMLSVMSKSEYILHLKECFYFDGNLIEILDLAKGNLADYITAKMYPTLSEALTFKIFEQMAYAIRDVHSKNIAHRDIKPENFLIKEYNISGIPEILLSDFGMSVFIDETNSECIPSIHSAPEVLRNCVSSTEKPYDGLAADMYSLGVCLYILYYRNYPHEHSDDFYSLLHSITKTPVQFDEGIPLTLKKLIRNLLSKTPSRRMDIFEVIKSDWFVKNKKISDKLARKKK